MHVRVHCTFLEVNKAQEGELILALNSINRLVVQTCYNFGFICRLWLFTVLGLMCQLCSSITHMDVALDYFFGMLMVSIVAHASYSLTSQLIIHA